MNYNYNNNWRSLWDGPSPWVHMWNTGQGPRQFPPFFGVRGRAYGPPVERGPPPQRDPALATYLAPPGDGPLAFLPSEIILAICERLDFDAYLRFRKANLRMYSILGWYGSSILNAIWHRALGSVYTEAVCTLRTRFWRHQNEVSAEYLGEWLARSFINPPAPVNTLLESEIMNKLHLAVELLTNDMLRTCRRVTWMSQDLSNFPFTTAERDRFRRNLYRLHCLANLFGTSLRFGPRFAGVMMRDDLLPLIRRIFTDGELAQMYAVGSLLQRSLCRAIQDFRRSDLGPLDHVGHAQHILSEGMIRTAEVLAEAPGSRACERAILGHYGFYECRHFIEAIFAMICNQEGWYRHPPQLRSNPYARVHNLPMMFRDPDTEVAWRNVSQSATFLSDLDDGAVLLDEARWRRINGVEDEEDGQGQPEDADGVEM